MSRHSATVRLLPNHWWDSSWATSRTLSQSSVRKFEPNADRPWASSGISSSSSVTTTVYPANG